MSDLVRISLALTQRNEAELSRHVRDSSAGHQIGEALDVRHEISRTVDFDGLPNDAFVDKYQVCKLLSCSVATVWRWCKDGRLPKPVKFGARLTRWRVGDLRELLQRSGAVDE